MICTAPSLPQTRLQGGGTGSPEQADKLRASLHPAETEASLVQKPTHPSQQRSPCPTPMPCTKRSGQRRRATRTLPRASAQRSAESRAPCKQGRCLGNKLVGCALGSNQNRSFSLAYSPRTRAIISGFN